MLVTVTAPWPGQPAKLKVAMVTFIQLTQPSGREFWVEVKCVCSVEDRGTRRRVRMLDQTTQDVTETAQNIVTALETT